MPSGPSQPIAKGERVNTDTIGTIVRPYVLLLRGGAPGEHPAVLELVGDDVLAGVDGGPVSVVGTDHPVGSLGS